MKQLLTLLTLMVALLSCGNSTDKKESETVAEATSDELEVFDYEGLKPLLNKKDDKTYVVNFWATWCAPCIKELPYFEQLHENYAGKNVEVILVSLDFPQQYEKKLKPYIKEKQLKSRVVALDDTDQNTWIPAIDESWTGAIPATIIYNKDQRKFYERSFTYEELQAELTQFITKK